MATHYNTRIVTDNLVLNLDAGNTKSYAGDVASPIGTDYGYFGGGNASASTVDRVDYSNDTATTASKGPLNVQKGYSAATGNTSYGYLAGGRTPGPNSTESSRLDYSSDTDTAVAKGPFSAARYAPLATSSRENGMPNTAYITAANIINPDSETGSGYWAHQYDTTFDWNSKYDAAGGPAYGYFAGGQPGGSPTSITTVDRIDYSSDTSTAAVKGPLSVEKSTHAATSSISYGYFGGGSATSNAGTEVDRLDYSNDTATAVAKGPLSAARKYFGATGSTSYGYYAGTGPSGSAISSVDRIDYSSDTSTAAPKGPLSADKRNSQGCSSTSYAYFAGGSGGSPARVSTTERIDFSNDTATAVTKGPLNSTENTYSAGGNTSYGWWMGGYPSQTTVQRIDYSNDTATASVRGNLSVNRGNATGTGSADYGYTGGGNGPISSVDRVDYSNDTPTAAAKGPLSTARIRFAATSAQDNAFPAGTTELYTCALSPVNDGNWHHVVMTRVGGTQQTYYDGVGITTTAGTYTDSTNYSGVDGWLIGKGNPSVGVSTFSGNLANITIRKGKGLSSDEVQQNFNALRKRFGV